MNKFRKAILAVLGISTFSKVDDQEVLTADERAKLKNVGFTDLFLDQFEAELKNPESAEPGNVQHAAVAAMLAQTVNELSEARAELAALRESSVADSAELAARASKIETLQQQVDTLSKLPDVSASPSLGQAGDAAAVVFDLQNSTQLGGQAGEMYSLSRPYNQRARAAMLAAQGVYMAAPAENPLDFQSLNEDLGAFYRRPWKEQIQSFLVKLPSITRLFPEESGHQDLDTLVTLFVGEMSQADSSNVSDFDKVVKGQFDLQPETLRMYGVMFVHKFKSMKALENSWIGYLNSEGSNPVKLSFIEYLMVEAAKALHNEQQLRMVNGVRKNPDVNKPGRAMEAADGLYEYVRKRVDGFICFNKDGGLTGRTVHQIKPFKLPRITPGNIGDVVYEGTAMVPSAIRDTGTLVLYMPSFMEAWYNKFNAAKYGRDQDYKPDSAHVKEFPSVAIKYVPNADNHHRLIWTIDGNIKTYSQVAGEMYKFSLQIDKWDVSAWSNWKESIQALAVGKMFTDPADLDGTTQMIWCNDYDRPDNYFVEGTPDQNPDVKLHSSVVTPANSEVYTITDIENAGVGQIVSIKCGVAGDNGVMIKKEGNFSLISGNWNPGRGDVIRLMKRADGKFIEISRVKSGAEPLQFAPDVTAPSVLGSTVFITGLNTKATALTDLTDAAPGVVYTIHGSGTGANVTTIANGGKFVLTAAMSLSSGKFIKLVKATGDEKFYEVERG